MKYGTDAFNLPQKQYPPRQMRDIETQLTTMSGRKIVAFTRWHEGRQFSYSAYVGMVEKFGKTRREAVLSLLAVMGESVTVAELERVPGP